MTPEIQNLAPVRLVSSDEPVCARGAKGETFTFHPVLRIPDNAAPPADAFAAARFVPASVVDREFASFAAALGGEPASRDVSRTVARLRARGADPLDLATYELTAGPSPASAPIAPMWPSGETTRRIKRAAAGLAAVILLAVVLRVGVGL